MSEAWIFPGQGSQMPGMGKGLYNAFDEAREVFDAANDILGFSVTDLCFGGNPAALLPTDIAQIAIYTCSVSVQRVLGAQQVVPDMVAGHSVGEYAALCAANAISFEDGLRTVRRRGQLMAGAGAKRAGAMAAIMGLGQDAVRQLCEDASRPEEIVVAANLNSPLQIVVSGDVDAVERLMANAKMEGARLVTPLPVSGAFHSPLMEGPKEEFRAALAELRIDAPQCPVYLNVTAQPAESPSEIPSGNAGSDYRTGTLVADIEKHVPTRGHTIP